MTSKTKTKHSKHTSGQGYVGMSNPAAYDPNKPLKISDEFAAAMPKPRKGQYHYAIKALREEIDTVMQHKTSFTKPNKRLRSLEAALDVLEMNNIPPPRNKPNGSGKK